MTDGVVMGTDYKQRCIARSHCFMCRHCNYIPIGGFSPLHRLGTNLVTKPTKICGYIISDLIEEIRSAGARVMLKADGDIAGALLAAYPDDYVDVLLGIGGATEGIIAACAVKALRGAMLVRLAPQSESERERILAAGLDPKEIRSCDDLVTSNDVFFAATGITDGPLLAGVRYRENVIETQSVVLRGAFGTRRIINATHQVDSY